MYGIRYIVFFLIVLTTCLATNAQTPQDSIFFLRSMPIIFPVGKINIDTSNVELRAFISNTVPLLREQGHLNTRIRIRSAASPEGSLKNNRTLSRGRRDALLKVFEDYGVMAAELQIDVVDEEYELLAFIMRQSEDKDAALVTRIVNKFIDSPMWLKSVLMKQQGGRLWRRMIRQYFPLLRASRFAIIDPDGSMPETMNIGISPLKGISSDVVIKTPVLQMKDYALNLQMPEPMLLPKEEQTMTKTPRREFLAIKTNLLEWGAYVPQYGWCPMPNVELEYYPRHGHWTLGATFDFPWWEGPVDTHKYFRLNNLQIYTRYYVRNSNKSYVDGVSVPDMKAAFKGFYLQAYAQAFLYQIGFNEDKGWIGEGFGGGLGLGYALPLTKSGRWRLDFNVQVGVFATKYDPYVYGCPVEDVKDGLYYYDYVGDANVFTKREYSLNWIGPTRVGVSLSYDLFYRRNNRKGISFRKYE